MFVDLDAGDRGQVDPVAGVGHDLGEGGGLGVGHAAQVDGHEQRAHLVVGDLPGHIAVDGERDLGFAQRAAVALFGDDVIHPHKVHLQIKRAAALRRRCAPTAAARVFFVTQGPGVYLKSPGAVSFY